ncbi:hypothetical protein UFOVP551_13 [uncultured Caudovirales phage]|jgi:hypothetical protein|uniref:Uncharacterized protein n=1 Tax=uncultured Caudovirales phage TaxID=2100421 RepID=A0A6J5MUV3_9CAUD|nr:hypothetical protein UFOVP551_13 [uncultured Caudovirales phage]
MTKIIDVNKHGIRREIDHQKKKKSGYKGNKPKDINISNENTIKMRDRKENYA